MPKVERTHIGRDHWGEPKEYTRKTRLPLAQLTPEEQKKFLAKVVSTTVGSVVVILLTAGTSGETPTADAQMSQARTSAVEAYKSFNDLEKYQTAYLDPLYVAADRDSTGGKGFLGAANDAPALTLRVGEYCLSGTAYDTREQEVYRGNTVNGQASLTNEAGIIAIHPAGSNAEPLRFAKENGVLVPDEKTQGTLQSNGCEAPLGVTVKSINTEVSYYEKEYIKEGYTDQLPILP